MPEEQIGIGNAINIINVIASIIINSISINMICSA